MPLPDLNRRLREVESSITNVKTVFYDRYAKDPVAYAKEVLHVPYLTPAQEEILRHIAANDRVRLLIPSGNETGKSFIAAVAISWHYDCFRPSLTYVTSPSKSQVDEVVFRQLRMLRKNPSGFSPKASALSDGPDHLCKGYTAANATAFQGRHEGKVMVWMDEAEEIEQDFIEAAESFAHKLILTYNPTLASSAPAIAERAKGWTIIRLAAHEHPNIKRGESGLPPLVPNAITVERLIGRLEQYRCTRIHDPNEPIDENDIVVMGQRWRLSPVAEARIAGRRPVKASDAVYGRWLLDNLRQRETRAELEKRWPLRIACDVAHYGDDNSVIHARLGKCSIHHESHNGWNTKQLSLRLRHVAIELAHYGEVPPQEIPILIDSIGIGAGVVDQADGFNFVPVNTSRLPHEQFKTEYPNLRSQIAFDFEDLLRAGLVDFSRLHDDQIHDITEQLSVMTYELGPRGLRIVHPKKLIKDKLGRSPDDADAVLLAYYQLPANYEISQ